MAAIIKEHPWWDFDCKNCASTVIAEPDDVEIGLFPYEDSAMQEYYVECPKCGERNVIPYKKLTDKICILAQEKKSAKKS